MTCKEKLIVDNPNCPEETIKQILAEQCPIDRYNVRPPKDEDGDEHCGGAWCIDCWNQEVPGTTDIKKDKEKNMATTKKTKAQLMEELENSENTVKDLKKQLKDLEQYKVYQDAGAEMKAIHTAFMDAGFSDEQAFELIRLSMMTNIANAKTGTTFNIDFPKNYKPKGMMR